MLGSYQFNIHATIVSTMVIISLLSNVAGKLIIVSTTKLLLKALRMVARGLGISETRRVVSALVGDPAPAVGECTGPSHYLRQQ